MEEQNFSWRGMASRTKNHLNYHMEEYCWKQVRNLDTLRQCLTISGGTRPKKDVEEDSSIMNVLCATIQCIFLEIFAERQELGAKYTGRLSSLPSHFL